VAGAALLVAFCAWALALGHRQPIVDIRLLGLRSRSSPSRYTARQAGEPLGSQATRELVAMLDTAGQSGQTLLFCLRYDFPTQWAAFVNGGGGFAVTLEKQYFPYAAAGAKKLTIDALTLYAGSGGRIASVTPEVDLGALSAGLTGATGAAALSLSADGTVMIQDPAQQVFLALQYHFGTA
jgi:hypothetical protein